MVHDKEQSKTNDIEICDSTENCEEGRTVEVLYQKMGDRWFAFSVIDDEMFMGSISQGEIEAGLVRGCKEIITPPSHEK